MSIMHYIGAILVICAIICVGILSGKSAKTSSDFASGGGKANAIVIAGMIMGTLVGGSSTIGTAQLAYSYGMSAWWFTLGGGLGCLVLAIWYAKPVRNSSNPTLVGIISNEYGSKAGLTASIFSSVGMFINIISQLISATAIISILLPNITIVGSLIIAASLMIIYVIFGGALGTGIIGVVKLILIYASVIFGAIIILNYTDIKVIYNSLDHKTFFNLFARGLGKDAGNGLSLILGVITTQSYALAITAGKSTKEAQKGALFSSILIPPIGIFGILIGLFMRINHPNIINAKSVFPTFVTMYMPDLLGGIVLGTLLIAVVGTGAGLALGISTVINKDIISVFSNKINDPKKNILFTRICIIAILSVGCIFSTGSLGDMILNFAFMSMGLRAAVIFVPLSCALWLPGKVDKSWAIIAIVLGPLFVFIFGRLDILPFDSLFIGITASAICCILGMLKKHRANKRVLNNR